MAEDQPERRLRRRWVRWVVVGALVVVLSGGALVAWAVTRSSADQVSYATSTVSRQTLKETVSSTGTFEPAERADLTFAVSSTVTAVKVEVGDTVTRNQAVATADDTSLQADLDSAQAAVEAAEDQLTTVTDATDSTDAEVASATAQVTLKKSQLTQAKTALAEATLRTPIAGTVAAVTIAVGDRTGSTSGAGTSGSSGTGSSSTQITVINTDSYVVDATVGTAYRAQLKKGLQVSMLPTGTTEAVYGTVASVGVMATSSTTGSGGSATIPVTIKVTGSPKDLFPGGTATVTITVKQRADVLAVPTAAISTSNGTTVVRRLTNGQPTEVAVTIGEVYGELTEITAGLTEGDEVVIATRVLPAGAATAARNGRQGGYGTGQQQYPGAGGGQAGQGGQGGQAGQGGPVAPASGQASQGGR